MHKEQSLGARPSDAAPIGAASRDRETSAARSGELPTTTRLWNRNFALLWQGQLVSSFGKQAFSLAALLWLKEATGSGSVMGLVMMAATLPPVLLGPVAGVLVDRWDRRKIIAYTDLAGGLFVLAAAVLFFLLPEATGLLIGAVFAVTLATGLLDTFSQPSIGASVPDLVPKERLEAANGLNMAGIQLAVFGSQGASGLLFSLLGAPLLILWNAATYLYAGVSELFIRIPRQAVRDAERETKLAALHPFHRFRLELVEGFSYLRGHRGLWTVILVFALLNFFISPVLVVLPFFATDFLGLGPAWYGYLMAAFGLGSLLGFLGAGFFPTRGKARELVVNGALLVQALLMFVSLFWKAPAAELAAFLLIGLSGGVLNVNVISLVQAGTPPEFRGRIQALMTTVCAGAMPLGMALSGFLFDLSGKNVSLMFGASAVLTLLTTLGALGVKDYRAFLATEPPAAAEAAPDATLAGAPTAP
ncbi:MAG: MFS transporter [Spirochaetaceae bacterium]|nr:MFS transporter [Spirochaetaceae bacterium]